CAATQSTNPLALAMQVSKPYVTYSKKSSDYFLVQLPSPQFCVSIAIECVEVMHSLLVVLLSGDVETNPGPTEAILAELKKLSVGQAQIISQVQDLKAQLQTTDRRIANLNERMAELETSPAAVPNVTDELTAANQTLSNVRRELTVLRSRCEDNKNRQRLRRSNLIFYGIPDSENESWSASEQNVVTLCRESLGYVLEPSAVERAHRLGAYSNQRNRPIIVKFASFKTKQELLLRSPKLKNTSVSLSEDFSPKVRMERKKLLDFAKTKNLPFKLRFNKLSIGRNSYVYDTNSQTVVECNR
ncbi:unnamed protein product, partial [Ixodes persulcatus]